MTEWKLFDGTIPYVSTAEFHADRERAPHLEQAGHRNRLLTAARLIEEAAQDFPDSLSDLGCGDGGLLSIVQEFFGEAWGYDFTPANQAAWPERGVTGYPLDVFGRDRDSARLGSVVVATEVLEHLADPHGAVRWIYESASVLVCSSPRNETDMCHDECHAWAWDMEGYAALITQAGFTVAEHIPVGPFQVIKAVA
jgi:hypothetical protein